MKKKILMAVLLICTFIIPEVSISVKAASDDTNIKTNKETTTTKASTVSEVAALSNSSVGSALAGVLSSYTEGNTDEATADGEMAEASIEDEAKEIQEEEIKATEQEINLAFVEEEKPSYTKGELKLLACLIYSEAGNQPYKGKVAVGNVVLNRIKSNKFPNTMKEVIYQKAYSSAYGRTVYQFSVAAPYVGTLKKAWNSFGKRTNAAEKRMEEECIKAAKAALEGESVVGGNYLFFCRYYSGIASRKSYGKKIAAHFFY